MFSQFSMRSAALLIATGLSLTACATSAQPPHTRSNPADPDAPVSAAPYISTISGYESQRPVEPKPWLEQNQAITPEE